jgi:photosystem II stability/assembly factor-like uncharacterized protein
MIRYLLIFLGCLLLITPPSPARAQKFPESLYQGMRWRLVGPFRGGRTRAACGVPSEPNVFYIGAVDGGVWKSDDYGRTWKPIFNHEPTQSIGAIAVASSNPNIIYVASGEGLQRPDLSVGDGIYKSTDGGRTWTHLGLRDSEQIPALAVDPTNPNRVFAAVLGHPYGPNAQRGIFRSLDGGKTWQKVLYKDENTGGDDVEIDPANPQIVYATLWRARQGPWEDNNAYGGAGGGIYESTNGGTTWTQLTHGLPRKLVQAYVAIAPSDPNRLYATIATTVSAPYQSGKGLGFYRSDDAGAHWYRVTRDPRPVERIGGGDLPVPKVDPKNPNVVYSASIATWRSTNGGKTWKALRGAPGGDDYQNMWINPNHPNIILLVGDQGALVTVNSGKTWSSWYNQPTAQLYHVITDNQFPYRIYGGQQESGSVGIESRGNDGEITFRDWHPVGIIEYGYAAPDPLHPNIVYGAGRADISKFNWVTGQVENVTPLALSNPKYRADRTEPIVFSPVDPHVLYYAANVVFKTTDGGNSWQIISPDLTYKHPGIPASLGNLASEDAYAKTVRGAIYALAPSFQSVNTLWAGTDDGRVWVTRDGGKSWENVTPPGMIPWSKVTQIAASPFDDETAYVSVSRFRIDDLRPYIYRTHDGGKTWQLIVHGLPDNSPVNTVREDPVRKGLLFASTETSAWVSFDDGNHWQSLQLNLPHTSMRDLWIHDNDLIVATHGRSFWVLDDITPLRQISRSVETSPAFLFKPETAYRIRRDTNTDTPLPPDEPTGQNPPSGAILDYWLVHPANGPVTLEILDSQGHLVRRYSSTDPLGLTRIEMKKLQIPLYWVRMPKALPADAGMHRWVWNLHYPAPKSLSSGYPISAVPHRTPLAPEGPRALPGRYTVRLIVNGQSDSAPLTVKMDPRVRVSTAALREMFSLEVQLASMMTRSDDAFHAARSLETQLHDISLHASGRLKASVAALEENVASLASRPGSSAPASKAATLRRVNDDASNLYAVVDAADAAPTTGETEAMTSVENEFAAAMKRWHEVQRKDLPTLNQQLRAAGLRPMVLAK